MKSGKKYGLSDFQLIVLIFNAIVGAGVVTLPRVVGNHAGRDGWISILIGGVLIWFAAGLVYLLCSRFPSKNLAQFSITILGKPLGILVSIMYALYALVLAASALRLFAELAKNWVMIWTPLWVFLGAMMILIVYVARMGGITLGRLMELTFYLSIPAMLLFFVPLHEFTHFHLLPVGAEGVVSILAAVSEAAFAFLGFEVLLVFFPLVINRTKVFRLMLIALTAVTVLYAGNTMMLYGVLGIEQVQVQVWPMMNYLRIGSLPIMERVDNAVLFIWTAQVASAVIVHYYASSITLATLAGHTNHDIWATCLWPLVYIVAVFPQRLLEVFLLSELVGRFGFLFVIGLTLLLLVVAMVRGLDERQEVKKHAS